MHIEAPMILEDQKPIIEWAMELHRKHISTATIIEYLNSSKSTESDIINEHLEEMCSLYSKNFH